MPSFIFGGHQGVGAKNNPQWDLEKYDAKIWKNAYDNFALILTQICEIFQAIAKK